MTWQPSASIEVIRQRARLLQGIRVFFAAQNVLEVETPILSRSATTDVHLDSFSTRYIGPELGQADLYLNTSPELAMKRLLAAGSGSIYQITKVFRNEELGCNHNPEFSMLEWYRLDYDHHQLMAEVRALIESLAALFGKKTEFAKHSYQQLFEQHLQLNPHMASLTDLQKVVIEQGTDYVPETRVDCLDWLMSEVLAKKLNPQGFTCVYDYPEDMAALAKLRPAGDYQVAERFELYFADLELANGFHELTNPEEQQRRFQQDLFRRQQRGKTSVPMDDWFLQALQAGLPSCAGVAMGLDRLLMVLSDKKQIAEVLAFPLDRA